MLLLEMIAVVEHYNLWKDAEKEQLHVLLKVAVSMRPLADNNNGICPGKSLKTDFIIHNDIKIVMLVIWYLSHSFQRITPFFLKAICNNQRSIFVWIELSPTQQ